MTDVVSPEIRSKMMSGIKGTNTKPEIIIRKKLHALGFRFRLHSTKLPGKPDIVLPRYTAVIFINGCFWHMHDCHLFKWPATRTDFWQSKLTGNRKNDRLHLEELQRSGWRVLVIWECALKGKTKRPIEDIIAETAEWLRSDQKTGILEGNRSG